MNKLVGILLSIFVLHLFRRRLKTPQVLVLTGWRELIPPGQLVLPFAVYDLDELQGIHPLEDFPRKTGETNFEYLRRWVETYMPQLRHLAPSSVLYPIDSYSDVMTELDRIDRLSKVRGE